MKPGQHVIVSLRRMIAAGEFKDGERIAEIATSANLGVSRMPVRTALRALEQEGLVVKLGARGYAARSITALQIESAVEVRGVLEGLAARRLAMRGLEPAESSFFASCLADGDALFEKGYLEESDLERFYAYNLAFHDGLIAASGNQAIAVALAQNNHLPFASAKALTLEWDDKPAEYKHLLSAHRQHRAVIKAIERQKPDEAEQAMRAHAAVATSRKNIFQRFG